MSADDASSLCEEIKDEEPFSAPERWWNEQATAKVAETAVVVDLVLKILLCSLSPLSCLFLRF